MLNRIAGLLKLVHDGEWLKIGLMIDFLSNYGIDWDDAVYDTEEVEMIFNDYFNIKKDKQNC